MTFLFNLEGKALEALFKPLVGYLPSKLLKKSTRSSRSCRWRKTFWSIGMDACSCRLWVWTALFRCKRVAISTGAGA